MSSRLELDDPPHDDAVEVPQLRGVDLLQEGRPLDHLRLYSNPYIRELRLHDLRDILTRLVPRVVLHGEGQRQAVRALAHAIAVTVRPSRFLEKSFRASGIVIDGLRDIRVVRPMEGRHTGVRYDSVTLLDRLYDAFSIRSHCDRPPYPRIGKLWLSRIPTHEHVVAEGIPAQFEIRGIDDPFGLVGPRSDVDIDALGK